MQKDGYRKKKAGTFTSSCLRFEDDEGVNVTPLCFNLKTISDS